MPYILALGAIATLLPFLFITKWGQIATNLSVSIATLILLILTIKNQAYITFSVEYIIPISFSITQTSAYFSLFVCVLWVFAIMYSCIYISHNYGQEKLKSFLPFYNLAVFCTFLIALSSNLVTTFLFYELLTLATLPLVGFGGSKLSQRSLIKYFFILSFTALILFLPAIFLFYNAIESLDFMEGGLLSTLFASELIEENQNIPYMPSSSLMLIIFIMLILGTAKNAVFPFNGWLPSAMCAPAPVSALLHAVAVVKSGGFIAYKIIYELYGIEYFSHLKSTFPNVFITISLVAITGIIIASIRAIFSKDIKQILAFSTISNMTYIFLLFLIGTYSSMIAGFWHIGVHGITKITLFFVAGILYSIFKTNEYPKMLGVFKSSKMLMCCTFISCFALMGLPLTSGFVSKTFMLKTLFETENYIILGGILFSTLATAIYFGRVINILNANRKPIILPSSVKKMINLIAFPLGILSFLAFFAHFLPALH